MVRHPGPRFDPDPDAASPLVVAAAQPADETLAMLRGALDGGRMRLAFQPVIYSSDASILAYYKAYIRLLDDRGRTIPAAEFMALAEGREIGREIDVAALRLGIRALRANPGIRVAITMSARSVGYGAWIGTLRNALRQNPGLGKGLILEIGEASAVGAADVLRPFMDELHGHGLIFTLDDFGAGQTALALLRTLPFSVAKIDGMFTRHIDRDPAHQPVVRALIAVAKEFGLIPVAESVETVAEAEWLRAHGVSCLQGYLFGAPEIAPDFRRFRHGRQDA